MKLYRIFDSNEENPFYCIAESIEDCENKFLAFNINEGVEYEDSEWIEYWNEDCEVSNVPDVFWHNSDQ